MCYSPLPPVLTSRTYATNFESRVLCSLKNFLDFVLFSVEFFDLFSIFLTINVGFSLKKENKEGV